MKIILQCKNKKYINHSLDLDEFTVNKILALFSICISVINDSDKLVVKVGDSFFTYGIVGCGQLRYALETTG